MLISVVALSTGPAPGALVWTGSPSGLSARTVRAATSPVLSPDGRVVAYALGGRLRVELAGGGSARTLTQIPAYEPSLCFSPDGYRIAFAAENSLVLVPVVGRGPVRKIALPTSWAGSSLAALAWSGDGEHIAFSRTSGDGKAGTLKNELDVVDLRDGAARTIYRNPDPYGASANPVFSPDSTRIAVTTPAGLATLPTALGSRVTLTKPANGVLDTNPIWSPDGTTIAFQRRPLRGVSDIYTVPAGGRGLRRLTTTPIPPLGTPRLGSKPLAWSPDSEQLLAFRHDRFAIVDVASRASRDLKRVGIQYAVLGATWR